MISKVLMSCHSVQCGQGNCQQPGVITPAGGRLDRGSRGCDRRNELHFLSRHRFWREDHATVEVRRPIWRKRDEVGTSVVRIDPPLFSFSCLPRCASAKEQ